MVAHSFSNIFLKTICTSFDQLLKRAHMLQLSREKTFTLILNALEKRETLNYLHLSLSTKIN
jgi:hypothetical protein